MKGIRRRIFDLARYESLSGGRPRSAVWGQFYPITSRLLGDLLSESLMVWLLGRLTSERIFVTTQDAVLIELSTYCDNYNRWRL